ncbi:hypothetical protein AURDEDRAFT_176730 [Auricularia subglabra TFB-10046 SS5]|uniref:Uncharacterized protein n=1 Tax=Auricularia subglabra (strain TFB-10046 / SS5) TaxID=717982 RepID=J0LCH3_AURST|nr:hypothetical protein AURDEDRAFT_176730 [Auricularia subglabra TFB-10046 SS5]
MRSALDTDRRRILVAAADCYKRERSFRLDGVFNVGATTDRIALAVPIDSSLA